MSILIYMLHVHASCPCFTSMLHVHASCPCRTSTMHVHAAGPSCMSLPLVHDVCPCFPSLQHVLATCSRCMSMLHVQATCQCASLLYVYVGGMSAQHVHPACPCCLYAPYAHVNAACPYPCCMSIFMLHVQIQAACNFLAACPC
jgi:hypothetical protein